MKKRYSKGTLLVTVCILAILAGAALLGYFGYMLNVQSNWRKDSRALAPLVTEAAEGQALLSYEGVSFAAGSVTVNSYFNNFITAPRVTAIRYGHFEENEEGMALALPAATIRFYPMLDSENIQVQWEYEGKRHAYIVSSDLGFSQLEKMFIVAQRRDTAE